MFDHDLHGMWRTSVHFCACLFCAAAAALSALSALTVGVALVLLALADVGLDVDAFDPDALDPDALGGIRVDWQTKATIWTKDDGERMKADGGIGELADR